MRSRILWEKMKEYYNCLNFEFGYIPFQNKKLELGVNLDTKLKVLNGVRYIFGKKDPIFFKCDLCGKEFSLSSQEMIRRDKKFNKTIIVCKNKNCLSKKKEGIIKTSVKDGSFCNYGKVVTQEEINKRNNTMKLKYPEGKPWVKIRTGKSLEEFYGKDSAIKTHTERKKGLDKYIKEYGFPHFNHSHTKESKDKMSKSHISFMESEKAYEKRYKHPVTGELLNWHEYNSVTTKLYFENLSEEERLALSQKTISRFFLSNGNWGRNTKKGYIPHWFLETPQKYDSSYEEAFFKKLNEAKVFWKKNFIVYIPYLHPIKNVKSYYIPDILIYSNSSYTKLIKILEVKPYDIVYNKKDTDYMLITKAKLDSLFIFCKENELDSGVITELDLEGYMDEGDKNFKNRLSRIKKSLLS